MQTQHHYKPITFLVMFTMLLCVVFASSLKIATDVSNTSKKISTQQILEEEPNEKDTKTSKEVFQKQVSFSTLKSTTVILINPQILCSPINKATSHYLKVHTPPPDSFI